MKEIGVLLLCSGGVLLLPLVFTYLKVRIGRLGGLGDPSSAQVKLVGPSVGDLEQVAAERLLSKLARPVLVVAGASAAIGGLLLWVST